MKNTKRRIESSQIEQESALDSGGIGLVAFVAIAVWLLLFQSNLFG